MRVAIWMMVLACGDDGSGSYVPPDTEESDADTDADADTDTDTDTDTGTDADGDGFTVEEGDCNDDDPWTNPGMDEEAGDGIDNDCDGRIDEEWAGLTVGMYDGAEFALVEFDQIGNITSTVGIGAEVYPYFIDHAVNGGWIVGSVVMAVEISEAGETTILADFSKEDNPYLYGIVTHPDGYYLATRMDSLVRIDTDGTVTELASWVASTDGKKGPFERMVISIALDRVTGEVALFDYYGGFAVWSPEGGVVNHKTADTKNWDGLFCYSGVALDGGGGWYGAVSNASTGENGVFRFNLSDGDWVEQVGWNVDNVSPGFMAINGDQLDYYITASAATYQTLWRIRDVDGSVDDFYKSESNPGASFMGVVSNYDEE